MSVLHNSSRLAQRDWTMSQILQATNRLMAEGVTPSVSQAAEAAGVSRATAYRYFPTQAALLLAVVQRAVAESNREPPESLSHDVAVRAAEFAQSLTIDVRDHEHQFRALLWRMLGNWLAGRRGEATEVLPRGGRIGPIEAAIAPLQADFATRDVTRLAQALSMLIGIEGWIVLRDMWHVDEAEAVDTVDAAVRWLVAGFLSSAEPVAARKAGKRKSKVKPSGSATTS